MQYDFKSSFSVDLNRFIEQKKSLGRSYRTFDRYLVRFDSMCAAQYPDASELTQEIVMQWAVKNASECNNTLRNRMSSIREFARFLVRDGKSAYIIPSGLVRKSPRYMPHIFTKKEISEIWAAFDALEPVPNSQSRHLVLAAVVRLLYCCGLRPIEVRRLKISDVDLSAGSLFIRESKGHKDRIVMMSHDLADYIRRYDTKICKIFPYREYFFPGTTGGFSADGWFNRNWGIVRSNLKFNAICGNLPRLYDLRHTFATHRLYEWMHEGKDLNAMLPYLSAYMGHAQLSDTYYYIHHIPDQFKKMTGIDFSRYEELLPEVEYDE